MKTIILPRPGEQRKVDKLLLRLVTTKPASGKMAPIAQGTYVLKSA